MQARLLEIHQRLCHQYACPVAFFHDLDPLSELMASLLSHRTRNRDAARAFRALRERFPSWNAVRDASTAEVEQTIERVTWPEQKGLRMQAVLGEITQRTGQLELDFLAQMPVREARDWLESLPGVGPKTSAATLLFSRLRMPALPVDSHHHRVAQRLGLIGPKVGVGPAHALLEALLPIEWTAQQIYDQHEVLMLHGQRCCYFSNPACERCVVLELCPYGQTLLPKDSQKLASASTPT